MWPDERNVSWLGPPAAAAGAAAGPRGGQLTDANKLDGSFDQQPKGKTHLLSRVRPRGVKYREPSRCRNPSDENDLDDSDTSLTRHPRPHEEDRVPEVRRILGEYAHQLKSEFSQMILPTANGPKLPAPGEPSKKNQITFNQLHSQVFLQLAPCPTGVQIPTCSFNLTETFQTSADELYWTPPTVSSEVSGYRACGECRGGRSRMLMECQRRVWPAGEVTAAEPTQRAQPHHLMSTMPPPVWELEDRGDETGSGWSVEESLRGRRTSLREGWNRFISRP
ncbi:activator of 90 kDa heat shock protein ATPase homolog 1-like isoform X1 [Lates japonicus]|uniref:Activator of 90 kDa heat shock protein ATPase homolog 1-like isoform X1 n=1 Tax=Lates japonicus TaxID=270547 RepID=A0AAD3RKP6_LATJO|nr:activator of 90 kDa heat shock protein ATPase homolog 1-like isoform X1 [Lates japonicus]